MKARHRLEALRSRIDDPGGHLRLELDGDVATLWLDNPAARNAFTLGMMCELFEAIDRLRQWDGVAVVLCSSTPGVFCAGGHLGQVRAGLGNPEVGHDMAVAMGEALDALRELPAISVAAVDGPAIGGGAELITACDLRVLGADASIAWVHARLAVAPGWGGARRLARLVGRSAALRILAEARTLDPAEALRIGLCDLVAESAHVAALEMVGRWRVLPSGALRAIKRQVAAHELPAPYAAEAEAAAFAGVWGGPDHLAALEALAGARGSKGR